MTTAKLSLLIDASAGQAKAEMEAVARSTAKVRGEVASLGQQGAAAEAEIAALRSEVMGYKAQIDAAAQAEARAVVQTRAMTTQAAQLATTIGRRTGTGAAGAVGNLTAQFNDVGMMMMAGQNPLQLAIQQGTQITQVIGPMGAAGAARALGSAFLGMLNPVSLVTMGAIAAGAAFTQWLTSADEEAKSLEDAVSDLSDATDTYKDALDRAMTPMWKLRKEFGDQAEAVRALYDAQATLARLTWLDKMAEAARTVDTEFEGLAERLATINSYKPQGKAGDDVTLVMRRQLRLLKEEFDLTEEQARLAAKAFADVSAAASKAPAEQATALDAAVQSLMSIKNEAGEIPKPVRTVALLLADAALEARKIPPPLDGARASAEDFASVDMASGIAAASAEARGLAASLGISLDLTRAITGEATAAARAKSRVGFGGVPSIADPNPSGANLRFGANPGTELDRSGNPIWHSSVPTVSSGSGRSGSSAGGGASKAMNDDLREAERLFEATRTAAEKYDTELKKINQLYAEGQITADTQARAIDMIGQKYLEAGDAANSFKSLTDDLKEAILDLAVDGTASFDQIASAIARAAWQATLFGEGPLAGLFGTKTGGGLLGGIFGALTDAPAKADGGLITGPGTGRSDSILAWVSNGEYIVNAPATARNRGLLEAINSGSLPRFATGGLVGAAPPPDLGLGQSPLGASSGGEAPVVRISLSLTDDLNARIDERSGRVAVQVSGEAVRSFSRKALPDQVQTIMNDRRARA